MNDRELAQLTFAMRIFDHDVDISHSTRESAEIRNHMATLGVTTMSAESKTEPGGYYSYPQTLEQFHVSDERKAVEVERDLRKLGREPVWKDWDQSLTLKDKTMRYDRQMILPEIGEDGQQKLKQAKVLIVGVGGLGSPIAPYLTGAGVGCIGLVDDDVVSISNLQRQVLYSEKELGKPKAICAAERLSALNSEITIRTYPIRLTEENAQEIISQYDIVVDGCDNFSTRYLINDICAEMGKVYVYGAICGFEGQVSVFHYGEEKKVIGTYIRTKKK